MRHTINLDCKTHHTSKDGTFPILLRVSLNGEQDYFNIGKRIKATYYDKKAKTVKKGIKGSGNYNDIINLHKVRIQKIIDDFDKKGEVISLSKVKEIYQSETGLSKTKCFHEFVKNKLADEVKHKKIKFWTSKFYNGQYKKLLKYRKKLSIHDIDEKFVNDYCTHITDVLLHSNNSVYHAKSYIRKYTNKLYKEGLISTNPFKDITVGSPFEVELQYLTEEELTVLHDLYDSGELLKIIRLSENKYTKYKQFQLGEKLQEVLRYFLISCYTGFRHSDIKTLRREHIIGKEIVKKLVKGAEGRQPTVRIPIKKRLHTLLDMGNPNGLLFENPVMETSQTNKYLKEIMKVAKIDKHITFHKARYTFGIISLLLSMSLEVIREILGHKELQTTLRYAKVVPKLVNKEMNKWDNFMNPNEKTNRFKEILCANCNEPLLKIETGVIEQKKISCTCNICFHKEMYDLGDGNSVQLTSQTLQLN